MKNMLGLVAGLPLLIGCAGAVGDDGRVTGDEGAVSSTGQNLIQPGIVNCESGSPEVQALCKLALGRVNSELDARGITIDNEGILFQVEDPTNKKIDTGHTCTVRAEQTNLSASARLKRSASLDVTGNSLTRPLVIKLSLPVEFSARIDVNQTFGYMILGSCNKKGSDSYYLRGSVATTADIVLGLDMKPTLGFRENGDYAITIEPKVAVATALQNTNIDLRASGISPITPVVTFTSGFSSTFAKSLTALFSGDSVSRIFKESAAWDFGMPVLLGIGSLPRPLEDAVFGMFESYGERQAAKLAAKFGPGLQEKLQEKVNNALGLENGKRVITIRRDFLDLLNAGAAANSLFLDLYRPPNPRAECERQASYDCQNGRASCEALSRACHAEEQEYLAQFPPIRVSNANPLEPRYVPTPPECSGSASICDGSRIRSCRNGSYQYQNCANGCVLASGSPRCR